MEKRFLLVLNCKVWESVSDPATYYFDISLSLCVQVKLWRLCDPELQQPSSPELTLRPGQGRLELVLFHPTSSSLLALGTTSSPLIWDTSRQDAPLAGSNSCRHEQRVYTPMSVCTVYINTHTTTKMYFVKVFVVHHALYCI